MDYQKEVKLKENEYQCEICMGIFEKGWSDEEAKQEALDIWGEIPNEERGLVCDECFKKITDRLN